MSIRPIVFVLLVIGLGIPSFAAVISVSSQTSFESALSSASDNDTIAWQDGTYQHIYMNIQISNVVIMAENPGEAIFTGESWVVIKGNYVTLTGLQFIDGNIGTENVLESFGSFNHFDNINISGYTSYKYLVIRAECRYNKVTYCNFENRLNLDDKNILSVLVDDTEPGYHLIQYCSFQNFDGVGQDQGIEPIRIGLSTQGEYISRTVVEYCYFTQCNGDGEIVSNKARQNVFRYNTFENNPKAEFVLRHGDEGVIYGNFFLGGMGGIRVKEGQNHVIYNNYFSGQADRSLILQNYSVDPLSNVLIAFNTFVETDNIRLGGTGSYPPTNVTFANNVITSSNNNLFDDPTGTEEWIGNIYNGTLGISAEDGLINLDPKLEQNSEGFYNPSSSSPVIDAALEGYPALPVYEGMGIDNHILLDLMKSDRPTTITQKDVGASEYNEQVFVKPHVTARNTGPSYFRKKTKLNVDPQGLGVIEIEPALEEYDSGTIVTITAIPIEGYEFSYWSGDKVSLTNPDTVIMNSDKLIFANFRSLVTEINDSFLAQNIELFPNPVNNQLNLRIESSKGSVFQLRLYDKHGRLIDELTEPKRSINNQDWVYDISSVPSGVYILTLMEENTLIQPGTVHTARLIKE